MSNSPLQTQTLDLNALFGGLLAFMVVLAMVRTVGHFLEPEHSSRKHLPKPVARVVTVPGGSHWRCAKCGVGLKAGEKAVKIGAETYCVPCARSGNPNSNEHGPEEGIEKIPLSEEFEEFIRGLPFTPERGEPLPDYVYRTMKPEFITSVMEAPVSEYGRELQDKVALDVGLFLQGGNFSIVKRFWESGWSSEDIAYDARIRHEPTGTEWSVEIWAPFDWRRPETYKGGFVVFLPMGKKIAEEVVVDRKLVSEPRWEIMPEKEWETEEFDLTFKGGQEASRIVEAFVRSKQ